MAVEGDKLQSLISKMVEIETAEQPAEEVVVEMTPEQMRDIMLQRSSGGLETLPEEDRERVKAATDPQLDKALEILRDKL